MWGIILVSSQICPLVTGGFLLIAAGVAINAGTICNWQGWLVAGVEAAQIPLLRSTFNPLCRFGHVVLVVNLISNDVLTSFLNESVPIEMNLRCPLPPSLIAHHSRFVVVFSNTLCALLSNQIPLTPLTRHCATS